MCCGSGYDEMTDSILPLSLFVLILGSFVGPLFYEGGFRRDSSDVSLMIKALEPSTDRRTAEQQHQTPTSPFLSFYLRRNHAIQWMVIVPCIGLVQ